VAFGENRIPIRAHWENLAAMYGFFEIIILKQVLPKNPCSKFLITTGKRAS
jgi:hypothetical protein